MSADNRIRSTSVVFPLLLIAVGLLFLLRRWMPDIDPWPVLWKYWPLLLILIGAGMFWDRTQSPSDPQYSPGFPVGSTIGTLLFLFVFAFLVWHYRGYPHRGWDSVSAGTGHRGHESETVERKDAKAVHMLVHLPAGELYIQGGADRLLESDFYQGTGWSAPMLDYSVTNGVGTLTINQQSSPQWGGNSDNMWKLRLNDNVPLELDIDIGAGRGDLNLSKLDLTRFHLNIGAGQAIVDLTGERGKDLQAEIQGGVGEAVVRLPKNVGVIATVHGGLGAIDVRGLKEEEGSRYVNAAYGKAPNTLRLTVEGGVGHIKLEQE